MTLTEMKSRMTEKLNRQEEILDLSDNEKRDFTPEETTEFDTLSRDIKALNKTIQVEQKKEDEVKQKEEARAQIALNKMNRGEGKKSEEQKVTEKFSFLRALNQLSEGKRPDQLEGAEGEVHQEAKREARESGKFLSGFGMPAFMMRAQDAATAATAGNLIATSLDSTLIPALRPKTVLAQLGAMTMSGLVGNLDLPAGDGIASATWEGETDAMANTDPSTRLVNLRPNRLAAVTTLSKQLLMQSSFSAEQWVRSELENAVARAVDSAGIQGNSGDIDGILGTSGVSDITFGGAVTRAKLINLITKVAVENADVENMGFLMNPIIKGELQNLETDSGSGLFVMDKANELFGYKVGISTLVPTNISSTKTAVIFGNFRDLVIANWGGLDIIVNPYSLDTTSQVRITINSFWDIKLKQPKSFAFGNDITWTALS